MSVADKVYLRKRAVIESVNDELKNIAQIEHSRHRSVNNFMVNAIYLPYISHTNPIVLPYSCHTLAILESMAALWHQYGISMASTCQILARYLPDAWLGRRNVIR